MASELQQYHNGLIEQKRIFRLVDRSLTEAKSDSDFRELTIVAAIVKSSETMGLQQDGSGTVLWLLLENKSRDDAQPAVQVMSELAHQRNNNIDALLRKQFLIDAEKFHVKHRLRKVMGTSSLTQNPHWLYSDSVATRLRSLCALYSGIVDKASMDVVVWDLRGVDGAIVDMGFVDVVISKKRGVDVVARGMGSVDVGVGVRREVVLRVVRVCKAIFQFHV
ncbi:unnamed protein product [Brassica oleracea var. botrytis]